MFDQITLLLSFVFAVALTHLLLSATELLQARDRVVVSPLLALWMLNALIGLVVNWLAIWQLSIVKHWRVGDVLLQFVPAMVQYFTCSLVSMKTPDEGAVDMPSFWRRQRPLIGAAFAASLFAMTQNYVYRDSSLGFAGNDWIKEDLLVTPMLIGALLGGWAKPVWLQWVGGIVVAVSESCFLATFAMPA